MNEAVWWHTAKRALHHRRGGLVALVLGLGATLAAASAARPVFKSESVLLYRAGARHGYGEELDPARRAGARLQDMLMSRERLVTIVREMGLFPGRDPREAAEDMIKGTTFRVRDGSTFGIGFEAEDPGVAQEVTRRLGDSLIADNSRQRSQEASEHKVFLDQEKRRAEAAVRAEEAKLADFLYKHPKFVARASQPGALASTSAEGVTTAATGTLAIELQLEELRAELATASSAAALPSPALRAPPQLVAARVRADAELGAAERALVDVRQRLTEEHPDVRAAVARVQTAKVDQRQAAAAIDGIGSDGATEASPTASLERRIRLLEAQLVESRRRTRSQGSALGPQATVAVEVEWQAVSREVTWAREKLERLGNRQFQADLLATLESSGQAGLMVVVDPAYRPVTPVRDSRPKVAAAGAFVALLLALAWMGLRAAVDDRLYEGADVGRLVGVPLLAVVPRALYPRREGRQPCPAR